MKETLKLGCVSHESHSQVLEGHDASRKSSGQEGSIAGKHSQKCEIHGRKTVTGGTRDLNNVHEITDLLAPNYPGKLYSAIERKAAGQAVMDADTRLERLTGFSSILMQHNAVPEDDEHVYCCKLAPMDDWGRLIREEFLCSV